jgi:membrane-associated protein
VRADTLLAAAILGGEFGYYVGKKYGWTAVHMLSKKYSTEEYKHKAHAFYTKWGFYATILVRFVPVLRSLLPTVAGMADMPHKQFTLANIIGAVAWCVSVTLTGILLGHHISSKMMVVIPTVGFVGLGLVLPAFLTWWHQKK